MEPKIRLMAVLAHPDDESLGFGGSLARYSAQGVQTFLVTATRGENGRNGRDRCASPELLGQLRESELMRAATKLGISDVRILGYSDGGIDRVPPHIAIEDIAKEIQRVKPHLVLTFGPDGAYGHPDHIAISQFTTAAVLRAGHCVAKLYHLAWTAKKWDAYQSALKKLTSKVDGVERQAQPWPDWAITTVVDTVPYSNIVWDAVRCHQTQMSIYENLQNLTPEQHHALWGSQEFYRASSLVNGGRAVERDLLEGLL